MHTTANSAIDAPGRIGSDAGSERTAERGGGSSSDGAWRCHCFNNGQAMYRSALEMTWELRVNDFIARRVLVLTLTFLEHRRPARWRL